MSLTKRPTKTFLVWDQVSEQFKGYHTMHEAVVASGDVEAVYEAKLKRLGRFKIHTQILPHDEPLGPVRRGQRRSKKVVDTSKPTTKPGKRKYTKRSKFWGK